MLATRKETKSDAPRTSSSKIQQSLRKASPSSSIQPISAAEINVLIVDDVSLNLTLLASMVKRVTLQIYGVEARVIRAENGAEAVEKFEAAIKCGKKFNIIFMDVQMPVMNGRDASERIRLLEYGYGVTQSNKVPIICLSGIVENATHFADYPCMTDFLPKTVEISNIKAVFVKYVPLLKLKVTDEGKEESKRESKRRGDGNVSSVRLSNNSGISFYSSNTPATEVTTPPLASMGLASTIGSPERRIAVNVLAAEQNFHEPPRPIF